MLSSEDHPQDLKEALSVTPFLHLIPKQDLAPLLASTNIDPISTEESAKLISDATNAARNDINSDPVKYSTEIEALATEFAAFNDPELDEISFKRPIIAGTTRRIQDVDALELPPLERKYYEGMPDISDSSLYKLEVEIEELQQNEPLTLEITPELQQNEPAKTPELKRKSDSQSHDGPKSKLLRKSEQLAQVVDKQQIAKQAFESLVEFVDEIAIMDGTIDPAFSWTTPGGNIVLKSSTLVTILDQLLRIHKQPIMEQIDVEYLFAIQKMCLKSFESSADYSWNDIESQDLLLMATNLLLASKISLLIFNCSKNDKRLKVNVYFDSVSEFIASVVQDGLLPSMSQGKSSYKYLVDDIVLVLSFMIDSLNGEEFNEQLLTKLEYLTIQILFQRQDGQKGTHYSESLSLTSSLVLVSIYKNYPNQRPFILNEVLSKFDKLPHLKSLSHQTKLARGGSVQLFTMLLVRFCQSCDTVQFEARAKDAINTKHGSKRGQTRRQKFVQASTDLLMTAVRVSNDIANFFATKLNNNPDINFKSSFLLFLDDLSTMLIFPEWPGVEVILTSMMKLFLNIVQKEDAGSLVETFCFEMAGRIGKRLLDVRLKNKDILPLSLHSSPKEFESLHSSFVDTLQYVKLLSNRSKEYNSAFKFLLLKYTHLLSQFLNEQDDDDALDSENDSLVQNPSNIETINNILDDLIYLVAEDSVQFSEAVGSNKDTLSISSYISIILCQNLILVYDYFVNTIVQNLNSSKVKIKTRAVRILSTLVEQDPSLLLTSTVQKSISKNLLDPSALVRDAVIDLLGSYMILNMEYIDQFYKPVCDRLNDDSIQVRKRVLKLSKDMYDNTYDRKVQVYISSQLLRRLDDEEESISPIAKQLLVDLWFPVGSSNQDVTRTAEVMKEVVSLGGKNAKYFFTAMHDFIHRRNTSIRHIVKRITLFAFDSIEEGADDIEKALMLVSCFVKCDPTLISQDQLFSLQPLLVEDNSSSARFYCLQVLKNSLPHFSALRPEFRESCQEFLLKNLTKFDVKELHEAMPSVWTLCQFNNSVQKLTNAAISCIKLLKPFVDSFHNTPGKPDLKLIKLLHLLGCFGSYCNFETYRQQFVKANVGLRENETVTSLIAKLLVFFCNPAFDAQIRGVAVSNIVTVCTYHAKLFISDSILKVLDREFDGRSIAIKYSIILGIIGFLSKEDEDSQARNGLGEKSSTNIKLDVAVFHGDAKSYYNDGICAGIVQRYTHKILELCLYDSGQTSLLPVQFLQLVVRLGFANPKICMPTIIALESSSNKHIRKIALDLHRELFDKHESLTDSNYIDGLKMSLPLKNTISGCSSFLGSKHLASIYDIVKKNYSSRKKLITAVTKIFDVNLETKKIKEAMEQRNFVLYMIANLLEIVFSSVEEVLIIAHQLEKTISRQGIDLYENLPSKTKPPKTKLEFQFDFINCQTMIAILNYRTSLINSYNITHTQVELYRPNKADIETRQPPKVATIVPFSFDDLALTVPLSRDNKFGALYSRMKYKIREVT